MQRTLAKRRVFTDGRAGNSNINGILEPEPMVGSSPKPEIPIQSTPPTPSIFSVKKQTNDYQVLIDRYFELKGEMMAIYKKLETVGIDPERAAY
jgi:hypothetical protein